MRDAQVPITFYRKDYTAPNYKISRTDLTFTLNPSRTKVASRLEFQVWDYSYPDNLPLELDGEDLELDQVLLNGEKLDTTRYTQSPTGLTIHQPGREGVLEVTVYIQPDQNTRLEGLYVSNGNFFTQCEAQGFRRITYFPDRPDVLSQFTVTLIANEATHPVSLSNGNLIEEKKLGEGLHMTRWEDPFPKPAYLFALVAGRFVCQEETVKKGNGKPALLQVWVEPGNLDKTDFAMQSLKKSIDWDRERFGLDLDLDRFMIVATADFNMGAMENKGLNIFNTKFVFANPELATDIDFENVESVVGHEYFHNWTGNRVTCRDWFQLSLKEGLTVFRDQEFSADMMAEGLDEVQADSARAVKRIEDVKVLRAAQFPEDAGPMAHPIRPDSYQEINNFYTVTVYEKGAEVIRMQHTLLGEQLFQRGMQIYFERHDGQAVTCEDFVSAMETSLQEAHPELDLKQFRHWYSQAGTPEVSASWKQTNGQLALTLKQNCRPTPGQVSKPAFHIPVKLGFVEKASGRDMPLQLENHAGALHGDVLDFTEHTQTFVFTGLDATVVPSLLRGFSAPVILQTTHTTDDLIFLAGHDNDPFNRWDACQKIYGKAILDIYLQRGQTDGTNTQAAVQIVENLLNDKQLSDGFLALALQLPSEGTLLEAFDGLVDPVAMHFARSTLRDLLACTFGADFKAIYEARNVTGQPYNYNAVAASQRALKNVALAYLVTAAADEEMNVAKLQYAASNNMTDRMAALSNIVHNGPGNPPELAEFFERFKNEALAVDKWFMLQATVPASNENVNTLQAVRELLKHPSFTLKNPNRARSLLAAFAMQNPSVFHSHSGEGYALWADLVIELNTINPQVAARMARGLDRWTKLVPALQEKAHKQLERILNTDKLSPDVREVIGKALDAATH
ncbi:MULTISPECIES: aminopeptidase N [unclassified Limnobacter]|uniref:aminopeptidase N n=1 Tax=unclassified Limnobacter TaxID=2630203 RepID=UPI000C49B4FA|nr:MULTISPECIES: aminopeptidase N [unclassified Limnobacter]MAZ08302.1 aminopeptidase N [Sutterellaceae bacterium]|tara:strand:+ start:21495 stop:24209 length:2715 start_codon:yes stop_codon:yes gene_type:complete